MPVLPTGTTRARRLLPLLQGCLTTRSALSGLKTPQAPPKGLLVGRRWGRPLSSCPIRLERPHPLNRFQAPGDCVSPGPITCETRTIADLSDSVSWRQGPRYVAYRSPSSRAIGPAPGAMCLFSATSSAQLPMVPSEPAS